MALALNRTIPIAPRREQTEPPQPSAPTAPTPAAPRAPRLRSVIKFIWHALVVAFSGPGLEDYASGIDDSAFPSSFKAAYGRGSRSIRALWHEPF